ncbi:MAG: LysR family transcriptional regulator [Comamonadaceae bacterium]|nr:MAG: LysR family transcriptional regulator [Comamonadaceae bacterium]
METKWLEDFVSLAETRSFSRSAQLRHVTQPAFSRRIQALEGWAGTDLVDRTSYPTRLTPAGQTLYTQAIEMLQGLQSTRAMLRGHSAAAHDVIEFAVPHTLAFTFFPAWVTSLRAQFGPLKSRLIALNVHDAVLRLVEGSCDLLIAYQHPSQPLPYLGYAPGAYLGRMVDQLLKTSETAIHLDRVYETDMAEGLKAMALEGHGIAFLPHSAVRKEVKARKLVSALPPEIDSLEVTMEIRAYRELPAPVPAGKPARGKAAEGVTQPKTAADALWAFLVAQQSNG